MGEGNLFRILIAFLLVAGGTAAVWASDAGVFATLAAAMTGVGAALIAGTYSAPAAPAASRHVERLPEFTAESNLIAGISEPVVLIADNRVRVANAAARALLGDHIVGQDMRLAIRHPAAAERLAPGAADGSVELVGIGGRDTRIEMLVATISPGQRIVHLIDRTTRHAAEQARVDFVANASHELRTPLAAILGFIETLDDDKAGGDAAVRARFLEVMLKEARRMQRLIDDLISLSRIEAEKYALPGTTVALPGLIEEVAGELRDENGGKRAGIMLSIDNDVPEVAGDRAQLSQVLHNLVGNALKYGKADAPVTIALKSEGPLIRLSVRDDGDGISPEHLPRLTERFYRVDPSRSRAQGGTGLGLAIVKHIVERHRGRLDIVSRIGAGTTVSVLLPAAAKATVTETSPE